MLSALLLVGVAAVSVWESAPQGRDRWTIAGPYDVCFDDFDSGEVVGRATFSNNTEFEAACRHISPCKDLTRGGLWGIRYWCLAASLGTVWAVAVSFWYPIALFAVLPSLWAFLWIRRRRFRFSLRTVLLLPLAVSAFFALWAMTEWMGIPAVTARVGAVLGRNPLSERVCDDPRGDDDRFDRECHYTGNGCSPFPFIVAVDCGVRSLMPGSDAHFWGQGRRAYYLWLFGWTLHLKHWDRGRWTVV